MPVSVTSRQNPENKPIGSKFGYTEGATNNRRTTMKHIIITALALLAATSAVAQKDTTVAYRSAGNESLVLSSEKCEIPGMPSGASKATFVGYRVFAEGCYTVRHDRETVLVIIPGRGQREMQRWEFQQWNVR
jgi:hypothetical protein